ncbi:hypothetical protein GCM10028808_04410 [Spirosoma migulaei]
MKKFTMTVAMTLLVGSLSGWAQSGTSAQSKADKQAPSSTSQTSKANNSQLKGTGVPYNKDKQQFGKQTSTKKSGPIPPSSVGSGPETSDAAQEAKTPGSHAAQRERSVGHKSTTKTGNPSSKTGNQ